MGRLTSLTHRLGGFLAGQGAVQATNLVAGLALLWALPPSEYALYIIAATLVAIGNLGSDLGASQGIITLGTKAGRDEGRLAALLAASQALRLRLFLLAAVPLLALGAYMMAKPDWPLGHWLPCLLAVFASLVAQRRIPYFTGLFHVRQDSRALFLTGIWPAAARLACTLVICWLIPLAWVALAVNVAALLLQDSLASRHASLTGAARPGIDEALRDLTRFVRPLIPGVLYVLVQGQISILLLGFMGFTESIAEVGALGRLGQILALLAMLNPFFVQPTFAAIRDTKKFASRASMLVAALLAFSTVMIASAYLFPEAWLFILGPHYRHLGELLGIAVGGPLLGLLGGTLYTMVIATGRTRHQWLQIPLGIGAQAAFLWINGIGGTRDALVLSWLPALGYVGLQSILLAWILTRRSDLARPAAVSSELRAETPP